jgi:hypothetical protein
MRNLPASVLLIAAGVASISAQDTTKAPKPVRASITDSHEGMTVGVEPWTQPSRYKQKFPRKSPLMGGVVAIQVSFRNDSDQSINVDLQRIRLLVQISEDSRQELNALSAEEVADAVLLKSNGKDPTAKRVPLPIPIPSTGVKTQRDAKWNDFRDACQNAAVPTSVVASHSTVEGLLYFNLRGEVELLQSSRLYIPNLLNMSDHQPLSYFDIALGSGAATE